MAECNGTVHVFEVDIDKYHKCVACNCSAVTILIEQYLYMKDALRAVFSQPIPR